MVLLAVVVAKVIYFQEGKYCHELIFSTYLIYISHSRVENPKSSRLSSTMSEIVFFLPVVSVLQFSYLGHGGKA